MLVHGWSWHQKERGRRSWLGSRSRPRGEGWHDDLGSRCSIADRCVWPDGIVVPPPAFDDDLCLFQRVEDFPIEQLVAELSIKALDVSVLPRATWRDVGGFRTDGSDQVPHGPSDEFGAAVGSDVTGHAAEDEETRQAIDRVG